MKTLTSIELYVVAGGWVLFFLVFLTRPRGLRRSWIASDRRSLAGMILQVAALAIVRGSLRTPGTGFVGAGLGVEIAAAAIAGALIASSLWLVYAAVRTLGRQWSLTARLIEGHELITSGPYALVRHPIYTAMLGMLLGSAIAVSRWQDLVAATAVFALGTALRVRVEERLLTAEFGDAYRLYASSVPALIPRLSAGKPLAAS